jgi:hypothetical protein
LLNKIKELSFRANIEPVWNVKVCGTPVQLGFLELNYFSREEYGAIKPVARPVFALDTPSGARLSGNRTKVDRAFAVGPGWGNALAARCGGRG